VQGSSSCTLPVYEARKYTAWAKCECVSVSGAGSIVNHCTSNTESSFALKTANSGMMCLRRGRRKVSGIAGVRGALPVGDCAVLSQFAALITECWTRCRFSQRCKCVVWSCGLWLRVVRWAGTNVSGGYVASIFRLEDSVGCCRNSWYARTQHSCNCLEGYNVLWTLY